MENEPVLGTIIGFSWRKSKEVLFPFHFNRWLKILVVVWLAASGVPGFNLRVPVLSKNQKISAPRSQRFFTPRPAFQPRRLNGTGSVAAPGIRPVVPQQLKTVTALLSHRNADNPVILLTIAGGALLLVLGFGVLFVWLSCRFNFVLLDVLVTRAVIIRESFRQHKIVGDSYFKWSLAFISIGFVMISITVLVAVGLIGFFKGHGILGITVGILGGLLVLAMILTMIITGVVAHDFVTPIMYREKIPMKEAWNKILHAGAFHIQKIIYYILIVIGFAIAAAVLQAIVSVVVMLGGLVVGGIVVVPGIFLIKIIPVFKVPLIILGVVLGVGLLLIVCVAVAMVMLPASIFFRAFALTYLTRFYPDCDLLNYKV